MHASRVRRGSPVRFAARAPACVTAMLLCLGIAGCGKRSLASSCAAIGACDPPKPQSESVDILCDASRGSTCSRETLARTLDAILHRLAGRGGSRVRLWRLGATVGSTEVMGEATLPEVPQVHERARKARIARDTAAARELLLAAAQPLFAGKATRLSPIAESVAKLALASDGGDMRRRIVVITDGREYGVFGDFECARLPSAARFHAILARRSVLSPAQLAGVAVAFAYLGGGTVPGRGCPMTVAREVQIRALWSFALREAGATPVTISAGEPELGDNEHEQGDEP